MKKISILTFSFALLTSCLSLNHPILSDLGKSEKEPYFQTYHITANNKLPQELANSIESAIGTKMNALGYEPSQSIPDLHIHYDIYEDNFTTLSPVTQNFENVAQNKNDKLKKIKLKHGSIYISLFNKEDQYVVWRGFSDGHSLNPRIVKSKAYEIMDHYQLFAASDEQLITAK